MFDVVRVAKKAMRIMLRAKDNLELILISHPGSSGARVSIFRHTRSNSLYAVKCSRNPRISLMDEIARKALLEPYLQSHLPNVLWCQIVDGFEVMISECPGVQTLHNLIMNSDMPHTCLLNIWKDVTEAFVQTWQASKHPYVAELCPRYFPARIERIRDGLQQVSIQDVSISNCWEMPVIVNGREYPSIAESIQKVSRVGKPKMGVVCHGDPQPSNIIVGNDKKWYCVDWEWSGSNQDWRMMVSHLHGWWSTRCLTLMTEPKIWISDKFLEITHDAILPTHLSAYQRVALSATHAISDGNIDPEDILDINRFLSALYFGELRFLHMWGREAFAPAILAQAIVTINSTEQDNSQQFQFSQIKEGV